MKFEISVPDPRAFGLDLFERPSNLPWLKGESFDLVKREGMDPVSRKWEKVGDFIEKDGGPFVIDEERDLFVLKTIVSL